MTGSSTLSAQISESYCQRIHSVILPSNDLSINHDALAIARPVNQPWRSGNCGRFSEISLGRSTISWFWKRRFFSALKVLFLYYSQGWKHWSLPYPRCTWYYTCDSSYITLLLLHHKVFVCYHKNGLVIVTNLLADGYLKNLLCSKNSLTKIVGYQQPTCLCVRIAFVVGTISLSCSCFRSCGANTGTTV